MSVGVLIDEVDVMDSGPAGHASPSDDVEVGLLDALEQFSAGSMCIGSSTGEIHGLNGRLAAVREQSGISMCFWGAFGK